MRLSRASFAVSLAALLGGGSGARSGEAEARPPGQALRPPPVIHVTDLFRPHNDPDDHWDLATQFALAARGDIELRAVLIDFPPARPPRAPDLAAVAQLNRLAGLAVPVAVGTSRGPGHDAAAPPTPVERQGVDLLLRLLAETDRPLIIHVTGSCRDVALAGREAPELFARHCAGVYLNAGTGAPRPGPHSRLEYNVALDPASYAAIFRLPCPVFWLPCFETLDDGAPWTVREFGSCWSFRQERLLPRLAPPLQNYFLLMFERRSGENWLAALNAPPDPAALKKHSARTRHMWCTAGFLHAAGWAAGPDGTLLPRDSAAARAVCGFLPIRVRCDERGVTRWRPDPARRDRFILQVRDRKHYAAALTRAMGTLLRALPRTEECPRNPAGSRRR